jgi:superfamily II DNA or RNA helicase
VSVVTGAGKTALAELAMAEYLSREPTGRVTVVVPTLALVDQWAVSLEEDLGISQAEVGVFAEGRTPEPAPPVALMTLVSAREHAPSLSNIGPTFLVVDECHRVGSPANARLLEGDYVATLGMSATPEREYDDAHEAVVVPALGEIIYEYDYARARNDGVIAPYDLVNVAVDLTPGEQDRYDVLTRRIGPLVRRERNGEPVTQQLERLLQQRARVAATAVMRIPVAVKVVNSHRSERVIVFHEQIAAADQLYRLLREQGHSVTLYHSGLGAALRQDNLRMYRRGLFDVLVTCRALDEGMNVPESSVAVIASSTASQRQRIQRLGRVLRPASGKERALVYTLYATEIEERRLVSEAQRGGGPDDVRWMAGRRRT